MERDVPPLGALTVSQMRLSLPRHGIMWDTQLTNVCISDRTVERSGKDQDEGHCRQCVRR
jgi:hypothetical protein